MNVCHLNASWIISNFHTCLIIFCNALTDVVVLIKLTNRKMLAVSTFISSCFIKQSGDNISLKLPVYVQLTGEKGGTMLGNHWDPVCGLCKQKKFAYIIILSLICLHFCNRIAGVQVFVLYSCLSFYMTVKIC